MADETKNAGEVSQSEVDNMIDESSEKPSGSELNLSEIDDADELKGDESSSFAVGEPMANDVTAIYDIPVNVSAVLGRTTMQVSQLLKLGRGAVIELDRKVGEAIDIYVNNRLVARGEVVVVEDRLGITMTEIVKSERT